jgi:hypothetical protein
MDMGHRVGAGVVLRGVGTLASPWLGYPANLLLRSPQISLEQQIQKRFRELRIIVHMLIKLEVTINHIFPLFVRYNSISEVEACGSGRDVTL